MFPPYQSVYYFLKTDYYKKNMQRLNWTMEINENELIITIKDLKNEWKDDN